MRPLEPNGRAGKPLPTALIETVGGHCGMNHYDLALCQGLRNAGCAVSLYTCDQTADTHLTGVGFYPLFRKIHGDGNRWMKGMRFLTGCVRTAWQMLRNHERICHYQLFNQILPESVVIALARLTGRKLILTVHDVSAFGGCGARQRKASGWLYNRAHRVIVHNRISRQELAAIGVAEEKIRIVPHGHYAATHSVLPPRSEARHRLGLGDHETVILFFGQIKEAKGLEVLIEAMPAVLSKVPHARLLIAGRPFRIEMTGYEALLHGLGLDAHCLLHIGFIPDDEVSTYYAAADMVALPYRKIYQSGVLVMAMTYGHPVIVSAIPGMTEMVKDRETGYLFREGSSADLAEKIVYAVEHPKESQQIGRHAAECVRSQFDWDRIGQATRQIYDEVLKP
jgi:glycosyltransferase involved in cell wall biosynthesis